MPDESLFQTVTRNITPEKDTSKAALGPGNQFSAGPSPQAEGETQYKEKFGSPQEVAYGKLKNWLSDHEQHFSDKVLKPFRQGLDNMAEDLQTAGSTGRTKSGGELNPATRALALGAGEALKAVPVGKDVKETAAGIVGSLDFSDLEGHSLLEAAPEAEQFAYRARPVGQKGVTAGERPVATSSIDKAKTYRENLESMTGKPHEVVQIPIKAGEHNKHAGPNEGETWYSFKKDVPEESVKIHGQKKPAETEGESDLERERRTRTEIKRPVKPVSFNDSDVAKKNPESTKGLQNKSRIVVEGLDEPKKDGAYSDKIKIDPFAPGYKSPSRKQPVVMA